jgi:hypothetical protein
MSKNKYNKRILAVARAIDQEYEEIRKKYEKRKKELQKKHKKDLQINKELINKMKENYTKKEIKRKLEICKKKDKEYKKKWDNLRIDERTQRKARLHNKIDRNAHKIQMLKQVLKDFKKSI